MFPDPWVTDGPASVDQISKGPKNVHFGEWEPTTAPASCYLNDYVSQFLGFADSLCFFALAGTASGEESLYL